MTISGCAIVRLTAKLESPRRNIDQMYSISSGQESQKKVVGVFGNCPVGGGGCKHLLRLVEHLYSKSPATGKKVLHSARLTKVGDKQIP